MKTTLVFPPVCDPTAPYIALPSLTAWLRSHGTEVVPIDANLECTEHLLQSYNMEILSERLAKRLRRLDRKGILNHQEQLAYATLWQGKRAGRSTLKNIEETRFSWPGSRVSVLTHKVILGTLAHTIIKALWLGLCGQIESYHRIRSREPP